jgi:hypothetical protein
MLISRPEPFPLQTKRTVLTCSGENRIISLRIRVDFRGDGQDPQRISTKLTTFSRKMAA